MPLSSTAIWLTTANRRHIARFAPVEPLAAQLNAQLVWVMGNHDNRAALRRFLPGEAPSMALLDRVRVIDGLCIITVDTSIPGFHHGDISTSQLDWLAEELAMPDRGCLWPRLVVKIQTLTCYGTCACG